MKSIYNTILIIGLLVMFGHQLSAQKYAIRYDTKALKDGSSIGISNYVQFRVFSFGKNFRQLQDDNIFLRDAIHAVIFRGIAGEVKPLFQKPKPKWTAKEQRFWKDFFAVKDLDSWRRDKKTAPSVSYEDYVDLIGGGVDPEDVSQYGKDMRIGVPVKVYRDRLRSYLIQEGLL